MPQFLHSSHGLLANRKDLILLDSGRGEDSFLLRAIPEWLTKAFRRIFIVGAKHSRTKIKLSDSCSGEEALHTRPSTFVRGQNSFCYYGDNTASPCRPTHRGVVGIEKSRR
jgi:hypothetical protein